MKYRPEIDGLRALAIIPVILFHTGMKSFSGGFIGVDIFFVISGYLITSILLKDIENNSFSLKAFYIRRCRRILPALFVVSLCCIPFAIQLMTPSEIKSFSQSLIAVSLFISNIFFWSQSDYFAAASEEMPLLHTWSLAVEEQYYLFFPILLVFAIKCLGRNKTTSLIIGLTAISLLASEIGWRINESANFYLLFSRAWELFIGSLVAIHMYHNGTKPNNKWSLLGLVAILSSMTLFNEHTPFPSLYGLIPVVGASLIILFCDQNNIVGKVLSSKPLVGIGLVSYSAYLWHQPLFAFARLGLDTKPNFLPLACLSLLLAAISYKYVERPFRRKDQTTDKTIYYATAFFILIPLALGLFGHQQNGFYNLIVKDAKKNLMSTAQPSPMRGKCHVGRGNPNTYEQACEYKKGQLKVSAFGDSHIVELAFALSEELSKKNIKIKHHSFSDCVPAFNNQVPNYKICRDWTENTIKGIINDERIEYVIVSYRMAYALYGFHEKTYPVISDTRDDNFRKKTWSSFIEILNALQKNGKKVIFVIQSPELPEHIHKIINKMDSKNSIELEGVPLKWWKKRMKFFYENIEDIPPGIKIIDPSNTFCKKSKCTIAKDGTSYYFDDDHMSVSGASMVAKDIVKLLPY